MIPKLYFMGKPDDGFGWGVCNQNLIRALGDKLNVIVDDGMHGPSVFDWPVFVPIGGAQLKPIREFSSPLALGYCFPEAPIPPEAKENAKQYHTVFAGCSWATQRLRDAGVENAATLIQGVDRSRFKLAEWPDETPFNVFSGGKFEYRKGQDIVLAAMREFMSRHDDVVLTIAWHNPWPQTADSMLESKLIDHSDPIKGIPKERLIVVPQLTNKATAHIYGKTHVGLFPNRCEAGTNMVMTEYMATGRSVIATNAHGHADVLSEWTDNVDGVLDHRGWTDVEPAALVEKLEEAYADRDRLRRRGLRCGEHMNRFTWEACADRIVEALDDQG